MLRTPIVPRNVTRRVSTRWLTSDGSRLDPTYRGNPLRRKRAEQNKKREPGIEGEHDIGEWMELVVYR